MVLFYNIRGRHTNQDNKQEDTTGITSLSWPDQKLAQGSCLGFIDLLSYVSTNADNLMDKTEKLKQGPCLG